MGLGTHLTQPCFDFCQTPVLGQGLSPRLRLGVDFTFAWYQQQEQEQEQEQEESSPKFSKKERYYRSGILYADLVYKKKNRGQMWGRYLPM